MSRQVCRNLSMFLLNRTAFLYKADDLSDNINKDRNKNNRCAGRYLVLIRKQNAT